MRKKENINDIKRETWINDIENNNPKKKNLFMC